MHTFSAACLKAYFVPFKEYVRFCKLILKPKNAYPINPKMKEKS